MISVLVLQHTEAEFLGLIEDHFGKPQYRLTYPRPFANRGWVPTRAEDRDALILLGAGPWGTLSEPLLARLKRELKLTRH
jgi:hypothetical protein